MSASIVYCGADDGTMEICVEVYENGTKLLDQKLELPYADVPKADLESCLPALKDFVDSKIAYLQTCDESERISAASDAYQSCLRYSQIKNIAAAKPA